ncbi:lysophospholipase L1-like esterase [Alkalibacillus flavidus]|uniref:Lysophospholipase L1-like esterase n=1 Tax=Alkalibacillus flavidus TaxID=546021 RepID=A0ABV2KUM9_9BACI
MNKDVYYRALGDSLTLGLGPLLHRGFVYDYSNHLVQTLRQPVRTEVVARKGMTSGDLITALNDDYLRMRVAQSHVITITVGGNDLLQAHQQFLNTLNPVSFERAEQLFYEHITDLLFEIYLLKSLHPTPYFIRLIGLYNPFPQLPYSAFWINRFNAILQSMTSSVVRYVDLMSPFTQYGRRALAWGGIHPNRRGYRLITQALIESGYNPLL